jgi:hypothetical protein
MKAVSPGTSAGTRDRVPAAVENGRNLEIKTKDCAIGPFYSDETT